MLPLFELFGAVFLFIGGRTAFPHLFFSTTPLGFFQLQVHSVIPCLRPLLTEPSPEGLLTGKALRLCRVA